MLQEFVGDVFGDEDGCVHVLDFVGSAQVDTCVASFCDSNFHSQHFLLYVFRLKLQPTSNMCCLGCFGDFMEINCFAVNLIL